MFNELMRVTKRNYKFTDAIEGGKVQDTVSTVLKSLQKDYFNVTL